VPLKDRVSLAIHAEYTEISIEGDNLVVIQALKGNIQAPWQIATILEDVRAWFLQEIRVIINHAFRESNMAAD